MPFVRNPRVGGSLWKWQFYVQVWKFVLDLGLKPHVQSDRWIRYRLSCQRSIVRFPTLTVVELKKESSLSQISIFLMWIGCLNLSYIKYISDRYKKVRISIPLIVKLEKKLCIFFCVFNLLFLSKVVSLDTMNWKRKKKDSLSF